MSYNRKICKNCKLLVEESERPVHVRCRPNQEELKRLEEIERLIRVYHYESSNDKFKLEMGENYTVDNGMVNSFALSMYFYDADLIENILDLVVQFTSLKKLSLGSNNIGCLPDSFTNLSLLEEINLSDNKFYKFPIVLTTLKNLKKLIIAYNPMDFLPDELFELDLLELNLCGIPLVELNECIGKLKNLISLNLSSLYFAMDEPLPESMGQLKNLKYLDFRHNEGYLQLPESIGQLQDLEIQK